MKKITFHKSLVVCDLYHCYPLGIILSNTNSLQWYYSNFLNLYWDNNKKRLFFPVDYDECPFLKKKLIQYFY